MLEILRNDRSGPSTLSGGQSEVFANRLMGTNGGGTTLLNVKTREKFKVK